MSNIAYELFASRLKESMNQQQMKPIDLLHLAEEQNLKLGKSHISQYVSGKTTPRADTLRFLADTLQVDEQWLLDLERKVFVDLLKNEKTLERIENMMSTGKPLRN